MTQGDNHLLYVAIVQGALEQAQSYMHDLTAKSVLGNAPPHCAAAAPVGTKIFYSDAVYRKWETPRQFNNLKI